MTPLPSLPVANRLLDELLPSELATFVDACEVVELSFGERLIEPGALIEHVYFPLDSFISLIVGLDGGEWLEVAMAGREGMVGESLLLGVDEFPLSALVQGSGSALRMDAVNFRYMVQRFPDLHQRLQRYLYVFMTKLSQTAACTHFHQVEARLARWLLMTHDRANSNTLQLTHEFLAGMLGVRRAGITSAALALQRRNLISYHRGNVIVLNREGLIDASCGCYRTDHALYDQVMEA